MAKICKIIVYAPLLLLLLLLTLTRMRSVEGGNILAIFQHYGYSHFRVYYPVLRALVERGHTLFVISYVKNPNPHPNYKELLLTGEAQIHAATFDEFVASRSLDVLFTEYLALHAEGQNSCRKLYESSYIETVLDNHGKNPYDLVLTEYFNTDCHLGVPYLMDVPVVAFSSCALMPWLYDRILLPDTPSYVQSEFVGFPEELNTLQRLNNFLQMKLLKLSYRYYTNRKDNQLIKKYLNIDIDIYEEAKRLTSVVFVNQHYSLSGSRPISPQLVEIGGVHITDENRNTSFPPAIADFLDKSKAQEDVILVSFGSMLRASSFDTVKLNILLKILQQRNFRVIWKWESDEVPLKSERVLFVKWLPQLDVLCHPKVKYFWGHGGMLGTTESVYCGKPLILTPIYGDQFLNAHAVQNRKIGIILNYNEIDEHSVETTLSEIQRPRYASNAQKLSIIFREREIAPLKKAVWYIEHILKHKNVAKDLLQTKAMHLNFILYHSLDSIAILATMIMVVILISMRIFKSKSNDSKKVNFRKDIKKLS